MEANVMEHDNQEALTQMYCTQCKEVTGHLELDEDDALDRVLSRNDEEYRASVLLSMVLMDSWSAASGMGSYRCQQCGCGQR